MRKRLILDSSKSNIVSSEYSTALRAQSAYGDSVGDSCISITGRGLDSITQALLRSDYRELLMFCGSKASRCDAARATDASVADNDVEA
eukprot:2705677-Pleurochrysis_carterae.AAC.2